MRIYDDPNHPQYGPVRRMWIILAQLGLLGLAEAWSARRGMTWDACLAGLVPLTGESAAQHRMLHAIMHTPNRSSG